MRLLLFGTFGCHLCEQAKAAIESAASADEYELEEVNIDLDPALVQLYGCDIPVVFINGWKAFKHRVDARSFERKLRRLGPVRRSPTE